MPSKAELDSREARNERRRQARKEKHEARAKREERLFELGKSLADGLFKSKDVTQDIIAAILGALAWQPMKMNIGAFGPISDSHGGAWWHADVQWDSMSSKILSQTSIDMSLGLLGHFGGGIKPPDNHLYLEWHGEDPAYMTPAQADAYTKMQYNSVPARACLTLAAGGAMAGFMGLETIKLIAAGLRTVMQQDLLPTP